MNSFQRVSRAINAVMVPLLGTRVLGPRLAKSVAMISYTGRRSGKSFRTPVNYEVTGDDGLRIGVMMPERKNWWRNFHPDPAPIGVTIGGVTRHGTAIAVKSDDDVSVAVTFTD